MHRPGRHVAPSKAVLRAVLRRAIRPSATLRLVDNVLNPRTHLRHSAEELRRDLARLEEPPTADGGRAEELRRELRLVEAELAALERHHRRRASGR